MTRLLVGAGGHAKAIVEALEMNGTPVDGYVDPERRDWLTADYMPNDEKARAGPAGDFVLGMGGVAAGDLRRRMALFDAYLDEDWNAPSVVHPDAFVSSSAKIGEGAIVLAGAVVQPDARIGAAVIVNTRAIIEHDSVVGKGSHVAPGAVVLGGCRIGAACMIGAGAVILPGAELPDESLVPALTRYPS